MAAISISPSTPPALEEAARLVRSGGLVAFPTETYYGLAADPFSDTALGKLFTLKGRPPGKPILTLIESIGQLPRLTTEIPDLFRPLMDRFWPGPLTLVFKARPELSSHLTGGGSTVGVRVSSHPLAQELANRAGGIITATSANLSGQSPAASAEEVAAHFEHGLDLILNGGRTEGGKPSTILGMKAGQLVILREGMVAAEDIARVIAEQFPDRRPGGSLS
jgi:L-threonylcarbamoyladenylate synthase